MFQSEKQLVDTLKNNYSMICGWNTDKFQTEILEEVDLGFGRADLVISKIKSNVNQTNSILTYLDAIIYRIIESNKTVSIEKLKEITRCDISTINKSLDKLVLDSYINKTDSFVRLRKTYKGLTSDTIAIEAKLKNWQKALMQAYRYKWFAQKSYVVLDSKYINPAISNLEEFRKLNVGLAEIDKRGKVEIIYRPRKMQPIDKKMSMLLNEQLRLSLLK